MPGDFTFDLKAVRARDEINDALGVMQNQRFGAMNTGYQPMPQRPMPSMNVQADPRMQMANVNVPLGGGMSAGAQFGGGKNMPYGVQNVGLNYNAPGGFSAGVGYQPQQKLFGVNARVPFQEGGLATSVRNDPVYHDRDVDFINTRNQRMRELAGLKAYAEGGEVGDEIIVEGRPAPGRPLFYADTASLLGGGGSYGGGESYFGSAGAGGGVPSDYNIGGLQAAINAAAKKAPPAPIQAPKPVSGPSAPAVLDIGRVGGAMKPSYGGGQSDVMRVMDLGRSVAGAPKGVGARLGIGFAEGGGAWTRKEGQNPEGGLNAVGRASLRAQGHDIKPPVSAKQAKKSPKAAARRRSFCARMSGMPGPMKDEKGRPTRKALSLRKWDCKAEGGMVQGYAEGGQSRVNEAGNYTKPGMRKRLFESIKAGGSGGAPGQWSARKAQMLAKRYKEQGGGYK